MLNTCWVYLYIINIYYLPEFASGSYVPVSFCVSKTRYASALENKTALRAQQLNTHFHPPSCFV